MENSQWKLAKFTEISPAIHWLLLQGKLLSDIKISSLTTVQIQYVSHHHWSSVITQKSSVHCHFSDKQIKQKSWCTCLHAPNKAKWSQQKSQKVAMAFILKNFFSTITWLAKLTTDCPWRCGVLTFTCWLTLLSASPTPNSVCAVKQADCRWAKLWIGVGFVEMGTKGRQWSGKSRKRQNYDKIC